MKILNVKAIAIILLFVMQSIYAQTPSWQWAFGAGSTGAEMATANATDAAGNLYTVGWYTSANITFGSITLTNPGLGTSDIFITKHSATGTALWAKTFGGSDGEIATSISIDSNGDIYVTGWFSSSNVTFGTQTLTNSSAGNSDVFVVKLNSTGNVVWAKSAGGNATDRGQSICVDANGNVIVAGLFISSTINFGAVNVNHSGSGNNDLFIVKYDASGNPLWTRGAGGNGSDVANSIATDSGNNIYVTGFFSSASINFSGNTLTNSGIGSQDLFLVKYNSSGTLQWSVKSSGHLDEYGAALVVSGTGVYLTGAFSSSVTTLDNVNLTNNAAGTYDAIVAKYNLSGGLLWAKKIGGADADVGIDIDLDGQDRVFVSGNFASGSINADGIILINALTGYRDMFYAAYDATGFNLWATKIGDSFDESANGIAVNAQGSTIYAVGMYNSNSVAFGSNSVIKFCADDVFIAKLGGLSLNLNEQDISEISLFPNPAKNFFYVNGIVLDKIEVMSLDGKTIFTKEIENPTSRIELDQLSHGIYLVKCYSKEDMYYQKIVVE
jgi:hypothetical protein